jgi:hypothetical protein
MEILNGKCKEEFEKWKINKRFDIMFGSDFFTLPDSMKFGVYQDFFITNKIYIEIQLKTEPTMQGARFQMFRPEILHKGRFHNCGASFGGITTARTEAIKTANNLFNEQ